MFFINPFIYAGGGDFESIATVTVGSGGASSAIFDNIGSTFQHLQLRMCARSTRSFTSDGIIIQFNTDTNANNYFRYHYLYGDGASAGAGNVGTGVQANLYVADVPAATATASAFGGVVVDLLDYASTSKNKVSRSFAGFDRNGAGVVQLFSGLWINTSAITKVTISCSNANLAEFSTLALYGVKAP